MKNFEYNLRLVKELASAGRFTPTLNAKIDAGQFQLRERDIVVKDIIAGKSGEIILLKAGNEIPGVNDFNAGNRLNQGRAFLTNGIQILGGYAADGATDAKAVKFGAVNDGALNEGILTVKTQKNLELELAVRKITQGVAADSHKVSFPGVSLNKTIALVDDAEQDIRISLPDGLNVDSGAGKNVAIAVILSGFEVVAL